MTSRAPHDPPPLRDFNADRRLFALVAIAAVIGVVSAVVAKGLLALIGLFTNLFFYQRFATSFASHAGAVARLGVVVVLVPIAGALIIGVMARFGSEKIRGHGIPEAIEAILTRASRIDAKVAILKPISAAISIGSGGPFGAEGPIIMTGGAFGSLVAQAFRLTSIERRTLLVAGAAAGMSAVFASPIASVLLAVEVLLFEWKPRSFVPVAIASATAAALRPYLLGGTGPLFPIPPQAAVALSGATVAGCVAAGLLAGAFATLVTRALYAVEDAFHRLPIHWMWWPALGAIVVGVGGFVEPRALGVGYDVIEDILRGDLIGRALVVVMTVKAVIWVVALGSGTSGGVLAPVLILGAALGGLLARVLPHQGAGFWPLVAMAAMLAGAMRAPLTGVVFALELTRDLAMVVPLLLAVPLAHALSVLVLPRSILTEKVSRRGLHLTCEYEADPLETRRVRDVMKTEDRPLPTRTTRDGVLAFLAAYREAGDAGVSVVDNGGAIVDVVSPSHLARWTAETAIPEGGAPSPGGTVGDLVGARTTDVAVAYADESLRAVVYRMARTGRTFLPVVARATRIPVGRVTLRDMLHARALRLDEEDRRDGLIELRTFVPWTPRALLGRAAARPGKVRRS